MVELCVLLLFQSISSVILQHYTDLLRNYTEVTLFLTMIVGAGGNASNQSAVEMIRDLATGHVVTKPFSKCIPMLKKELYVALLLSVALFLIGFVRVQISVLDHPQAYSIAFAIAISLFCIVLLSVVLGATIPVILQLSGFDPAHAGPLCQVLADILGVLIVCLVCEAILVHPYK